jgi:VanZ family protein
MDLLKSSTKRWTGTGIYFLVLSHSLLAPSPLWYLGSLEPAIQDAVTNRMADFWQHLVGFQLLAMLVYWARGPGYAPAVSAWLLALIAYAFLTEGLQAMIPTRSCELHDISANLLGVLVGWCIGATLSRWSTQGLAL